MTEVALTPDAHTNFAFELPETPVVRNTIAYELFACRGILNGYQPSNRGPGKFARQLHGLGGSAELSELPGFCDDGRGAANKLRQGIESPFAIGGSAVR